MPTKAKNIFTVKNIIVLSIVFLVTVLIIIFLINSSKKDLSRGILILNADKSVYKVGEKVELSMTYLDTEGATKCGGNLQITLLNPSRKETILSTKQNQISVSSSCNKNDKVISSSDYNAFFVPSEAGQYKVKLVDLDNKNTVQSEVVVESNPKYQLKRVGAVRINPHKAERFPMTLTVKVLQDFKGQVTEKVPESFEIVWNGPGKVEKNGKYQTITWEVELKVGQSKELIYEYAVPKQSPQFYTLGKVILTTKGSKVFEEAHEWQIATGGRSPSI